jgi:pterin-4a-carbinolamine dehydratase
VHSLAQTLTGRYGFRFVEYGVVYPLPMKVDVPPLTEEELFAVLHSLPGWEPVETSIPRDYPNSRHELRRGLRFEKFKHAIAFLQSLVEPLNKLKHHPRIENQWRTVFIHFTTWDVGNKITAIDIEAARVVDERYKAYLDSMARRREEGRSD